MFNRSNPPQPGDIKAYYQNFYKQNKLLVYLMGASLLALIISKAGFFDIIYYVYLIYFGGFILKQYLGEQKVLTTYLISGLLGLLIFSLSFVDQSISLISLTALVGSAALGLLTAAASYVPNMEIMLVLFGRVKIKWVALVLIALDLFGMMSVGGQDHIAHLGGIAYGYLSIKIMMSSNGFRFKNPFAGMFRKKGPYYKAQQNHRKTRTENDDLYRARKAEEQAEIDAILDKIKQKGYESLSAEEKQKLFDRSQRD